MSCALKTSIRRSYCAGLSSYFLSLYRAEPKAPGGGMAQGANRSRGLLARIDQIFCQSADHAVTTGVHLANPVLVPATRLDHAAGGRVDDGGDAARLSVERVSRFRLGHCRQPVVMLRLARKDSAAGLGLLGAGLLVNWPGVNKHRDLLLDSGPSPRPSCPMASWTSGPVFCRVAPRFFREVGFE